MHNAERQTMLGMVGAMLRECYGKRTDRPWELAADIAAAMQLAGLSRTPEAIAPKIKEALAMTS